MSAFVFALLLLAMAGHSNAAWCACKGLSDSVLQKTLDYACGAGADCNPIHQNGPCFNPNSVRAHCNFAVNSYFQKKGQAAGSCDFSGTATVTATDPSKQAKISQVISPYTLPSWLCLSCYCKHHSDDHRPHHGHSQHRRISLRYKSKLRRIRRCQQRFRPVGCWHEHRYKPWWDFISTGDPVFLYDSY
ncbi:PLASMODESMATA CALLOSE-BINDING PROTEIN 3 isoform X1 [Capsicum annuum]|uniref:PLASMODESMATA CALLOSE-BINDING PROTEIN 3 isoform X1 n=1 Tax=Capsicum annuum TaxID=4072 RepID=UPI0007BEB3AB|nr:PLASMODESMATA CALLOSE-BINDING PROTEIN 3 isoform X1 [Capsicum annuum]